MKCFQEKQNRVVSTNSLKSSIDAISQSIFYTCHFPSVDHLGCIRPQLTAAAGYGEPPPLSRRLGEVKGSGPPAEQRDRTIGEIFDEEEEVSSDESYQCSQPRTDRTAIHYTTNTGVGVKSSKCTDLSFSLSLSSNLAPLFTE